MPGAFSGTPLSRAGVQWHQETARVTNLNFYTFFEEWDADIAYIDQANAFTVGGQTIQDSTSTKPGLGFLVTGDTVSRLEILESGALDWGSGSAAADTSLARTSAGELTLTGGLSVTPASGVGLTVQGLANQNTASIVGSGTANESYGLYIQAGTSTSDVSFYVYNHAGSTNYLEVRGDGLVTISQELVVTGLITGVAGGLFESNTTVEGVLTVGSNTANGQDIVLNGVASGARNIEWLTAGVGRWYMGLDITPETGGNTGADFILEALNDSGGVLGAAPLSITRATGLVTLGGSLQVIGEVGFYGTTPIAQRTLATGAGHTVDDVITALQALGLVVN